MRRTVDIDPGKRAAIERIHHLGQTSIQGNMTGQLNGSLGFKAISAAGASELVTAIIRDVDLLVRAVNQEQVAAQREPVQIERHSGLIEIGGGDAR